jgi:hypothetical protein
LNEFPEMNMPTVPNPSPSSDDYRTLLDTIAEVLDVPLEDEHAAVGSVSRDRAILVRCAIDAALTYSTPAVATRVLRRALEVAGE